MNILTSEEYKAMTAEFRMTIGCSLADTLIRRTQQAFGTVNNVVKYYAKGLIVFATGERWIYNWNELHPRMYRVDNAAGQYIAIDKMKEAE